MWKINPKELILESLFGRWRPSEKLREGYTILLPVPMDMPFLLWFALEALRNMETKHCNQIIVIPDGWSSDGGEAMRRVLQSFNDPRIALSRLPMKVHFFIHSLLRQRSHLNAGNWLHWAMIVEGTNCANSRYAFLHDADAFFVDADALERQYAESNSRHMITLGVEYRWDAFFTVNGYAIPATWEMMYSIPWARSRSPLALKGKWRDTPHGRHEFDTMLYVQYLDYVSEKIGVMTGPSRIIHFHGTIMTYRIFIDPKSKSVADDVFRLLLLSMLQELAPHKLGARILPTPDELARGLGNETAHVRYDSARAAREFPGFRRQLDELLQAPVFAAERAARIREYVRPFEDYFSTRAELAATAPDEDLSTTPRRHGLG